MVTANLNSAVQMAARRDAAIASLRQVLNGAGADDTVISPPVAKIVFDIMSPMAGVSETASPFTKDKYPIAFPLWKDDKLEVRLLTNGNLRAEKAYLLARLAEKQKFWHPKAQSLSSAVSH